MVYIAPINFVDVFYGNKTIWVKVDNVLIIGIWYLQFKYAL